MSSGRDYEAPEAADAGSSPAAFADLEFIGPLGSADQAWVEHTLRADSSAVLFEPADNVIRRREAHIASLYRLAALLTLSGDLAGGRTAGFRGIAESRALAEFLAASPAYCLDCFLLGDRCQRHRAVESVERATPVDSVEQAPAGAGSSSGRLPEAGPSGARSSAPGSSGAGSVDDRPAGRASGGPGAGSGGARPAPGHQPEWRRFGADEFPSASG